MTEVTAKFRYVQLCRSLKTYGMSLFKIQVREATSSQGSPLAGPEEQQQQEASG